ncbi:hypothetical protein [Micromonospora zamorensis]|uniref:hypothetical protein n=1 Tax=Micromonospora zamorensis TaxID=709883 RepID=UPI00081F90A8|nr:hypothetical protein [Micromonospora zamorensis]WTI21477.1 hypothetical protein OG886_32145 [Micromonospora zamorensis]SCG62056.1 hypothetical protein GA0070619_4499 [Micromonospora zamorensis]
MHADASPFFIGPHRFDAPDDEVGPTLDRRYNLRPVHGERVLARHRLLVAGYLLGPSETRRRWQLPEPVAVTVTDQRICWVGSGSQLSLVADDLPRARPSARMNGLMSGQIRWQWPSRLELPVAEEDEPSQLLIVCDALRTIQQPALALGGPAGEVVALGRQVRRAVAMFRLTRPELVDLSAQERDVLLLRAGPALLAGATRVTLPGSLPVEFHSRDDYYRPGPEPSSWHGLAGGAASGHR